MKLTKPIFAGAVALLILVGCGSQPGLVTDNNNDRTKTGVVAGTLVGALIGSKGDTKSTVIGGLVGGLVGGAIGYSMDNQANEIARALGTGVNNDPLAALDPNNDLIVSKTSTYVKIMFRDPMMFASGSANLQSRARSKVRKVAQLLRRYPKTVVGVAGFTDNTGGYSYNKRLSQRRANTVGNILTRNGRAFIKGCSYDKAIVPNNSASNKALNRRVEVYLFGTTKNMINPCR